MALNPPCTGSTPNVFPGEHFILRRRGMEFKAQDAFGRKFSGKGELHVSTIRMVFVCSSPSADFSAFDIPLANITDESFNQPIFGANNLSGKVQAIANSAAGVTGVIQFKLYFNEGGCATFLRAFFNSMEQIRRIPTAVPVASEFTQAAVSGAFAQAAFVDPSDPSTVYVSQPAVQAVPIEAYPQNNLPVATAVPAGQPATAVAVAVATPAESSSPQPVIASVVQ